MNRMNTRRTLIADRWGNESLRVEYDHEDRAIESVQVWDSFSRTWITADLGELNPIVEQKIREHLANLPGDAEAV